MRATSCLRRLSLLTVSLLGVVGMSACGHKLQNPTSADTEGQYVRAGDVTYQIQLSRQLNQYSIEDRGYIAGAEGAAPTAGQMWFAIFLRAKNETHQNLTTTNSFDIVDTEGNRYLPVPFNHSLNPYAWTPQTLKPLGIQPAPDSTASFGPTQGQELLFKLDNSIYSNRPLTLEIHAPGQRTPTTISLDL